jgi:site-specific recombinase XerD
MSDLKQFQIWLQSSHGQVELTPSNITRLDIAQYKTHLLTIAGRKPSGVNRALSAIVAFCDWAQIKGYIEENPAVVISWAKPVKNPPRSLNEPEQNLLRQEIYRSGNQRDIAMIELMIGAGLRIGEVESLNLVDIQLTTRNGMVAVHEATGRKYRMVPLHREICNALRAYLEIRPKAEEALFISQKGGRLTANAIWKIVKKYGNNAGLAELTPQSLRHTFGTMLIQKHNVDIATTAALMGHESIATTAIYMKPSQQDMMEAVEKLTKS